MNRHSQLPAVFSTTLASLLMLTPISISAQQVVQSQSPKPQSTQPQSTPQPTATPLLRPRVVVPTINPAPSQTTSPPSTVTRPTLQNEPTPNVSGSPTPARLTPAPLAGSSSIAPPVAGNDMLPVAPYFAPPQPVKPLSPNKINEHIEEGKRSLRTRTQLTALGTRPSTAFVTIAALDPETNVVHHMTTSKSSLLRLGGEMTLSTSLGKLVRVQTVRSNYVNTALRIYDATGKQLVPLVIEYPIEKFGTLREMAYYTSAHPALMSPELAKAGQTYVRTMLELATKRLKDKGRTIAPEIVDVAERLCMVEHVDHSRFKNENRKALYDEVFSLFALNGLDTYRYSVSTAGAGGMVQMIPPTYQMVRRMHPSVGLNPDFVFGMRNHGNALEAMLLYMQDTWNDLAANSEVQYALGAKIATQKELMSAGYNSNPARLPGYLYRGGAAWRTLIPRETQMYLQIYASVESLVPMKERDK